MRRWSIQVSIAVWMILTVWVSQPPFGWADTAAAQNSEMGEVLVKAEPLQDGGVFLPDVQGTRINAGKKTSVARLNERPAISNNNYRQALAQTPGLLLSEESSPLFSIGYRGLDPHRGQFTQIMKDGFPIHADMFGYPEAYYTPILQTVDNIEFIRGGGSLMYGPQPGGALNYVTKKPPVDKKFELNSENIFGSDNYFSTYESIGGTLGPAGYLAYFHEREGDGFRRSNSDFKVISSGLKVILNQTSDSRLTFDYEEYHEEHGEPGGLSLSAASNPTYEQDRNFVTRQNDRFILERYMGTMTYEKEFSEDTQLDARAYGGHYRRYSKRQRGGGFGTLPAGAASNSNDIEEQDFYNLGFEPRLRKHYELFGEEHTLSVGTHTYFSHSPRTDQRGSSPSADSGVMRKESGRDAWYLSLFLENVFRWKKLSVTPGVRLEHLWQRVHESMNLDKTTAPLADNEDFDFVPLFGLGAAYEIIKGVEAYTNISQAYRPKIYTQSVPLGTNNVINEDLREGKSIQYDFGLRGTPVPFFHWDIDYFLMDFTDQIGTVGNSVENIGDTRHHGTEFTASVDVVGLTDYFANKQYGEKIGSLSPFVTLTLLSTNIESGSNEGRRTQYAPQYNFRTGVNYGWKERVKLSVLGTFVDDHFADDAGTLSRMIPSYKVWDLTGEVNVFKDVKERFDFSVIGGVNNLFNENYYARIRGDGIDPGAPRTLYGGVKIKLG